MSKSQDFEKVTDCISLILGQSYKDISVRTGVRLSEVKKIIKKLDERGDIEWSRDGKLFRYPNAIEFIEAKDQLPPWPQGCAICHTNNRKKYTLEIFPPRELPEPTEEERPAAKRAERTTKKGKPKKKVEKTTVWAEPTPVHKPRVRGQNYLL